MSDDYEPALEMDASAEPQDAADAADPNDPPMSTEPKDSANAPPVEPQSKHRGRVVSDAVRGMFKNIAKQQAEVDGMADDLVPADLSSPPAAAGATAAGAAKRASPAASTPPPPAAAAVAPEPEAEPEFLGSPPQEEDDLEPAMPERAVARAIAEQSTKEHEAREKALADREAALAAREKALPSHADIIERPAQSIGALLKSAYQVATDDEFKDVIVDLVTDLSESVLGVKIPEQSKMAMASRRALASVKAYKADLTAQQQKLAEERAAQEKAAAKAREEAQQAENERKAVMQVTRLVNAAKTEYPYLHEQDNPANIVVEVIREQLSRGQKANWQEAATLANNYFKKEAEALVQKAERLKRLSAPAAPAAPAKVAVASPGAAPGPAATPQPKAAPAPAPVDDEADRQPEDRHERRARKARELARRFAAQAGARD